MALIHPSNTLRGDLLDCRDANGRHESKVAIGWRSFSAQCIGCIVREFENPIGWGVNLVDHYDANGRHESKVAIGWRLLIHIIFTSIETPDGRSMLVKASITFGSGLTISIMRL